MRSRFISKGKTVAIAAAGMLLAPQLATASDVEAELRQVQERVASIEDRLQATTDQLAEAQATVEAQQEVIEASGAGEERGALSSLSSFLESTDFNAWVAASYNYKFRGTNGSDRSPAGKAPHLPYHNNGNTFQADQVWFEIDKAPTEESRGGAHIDLAYGVATNNVPGAGPIYTAYVSYLAPVANGLQFDLGVVPTLLGAEVIQVNANFNITRGLVWGLQPINHTGALASLEIVDGLSVTAGVLNEPTTINLGDPNRSKAVTGQLAYGTDKFRAGVSFVWGGEAALPVSAGLALQQTCMFVTGTGAACAPGTGAGAALADNSSATVSIIDVLLTADPLDNLSVWLNYDYRMDDLHTVFDGFFGAGPGGAINASSVDGSVKTHGIAAAVRLGVLDTTGIALRGEWVHTDWGNTFVNMPFTTAAYSPAGTQKQYSLTGTLDHALTDNLTSLVELRWDHTNPAALAGRGIDPTTGAYTVPLDNRDAFVVMLQAIYQF